MKRILYLTLTLFTLLPGCQSRPAVDALNEREPPVNPFLDPLRSALQKSPDFSKFIKKNSLVLALQSQTELYEVLEVEFQKSRLLSEGPNLTSQMPGLFWGPLLDSNILSQGITRPGLAWKDLVMAESLGIMTAKLNSIKSYEPGRCVASYESHFLHRDLLKTKYKKSNLGKISNPYPYHLVRTNPQKPTFELKQFNTLSHLNSSMDLLCYELALRHVENMDANSANFVYLFMVGQKSKMSQLVLWSRQVAEAYESATDLMVSHPASN